MSTSELRRMEEGLEGGVAEGEGAVGEDGSRELKELYYPRRNGWNWPWHPLQVLAWAFIVLFTTSYFGFLVFYIPGAWRSIAYIVAGVLLATHILASLVTSTMDPAESSVRRRRVGRTGGFLRAVFDRKKHKRVIENRYCNLCEVKVTYNAKHCSVCDKCVKGFDHHCIWLNTCIGSRNYRWFLVTVFSALVACVLLLVFTLSVFVTFFSARDGLRYACSHHFLSTNTSCNVLIRVFGAEVPDAVFPTLVAVIGLLALVGVAMIGYLAIFHVYLIIKGLTTYDYIVLQRQLKKEKEEAEGGAVVDEDHNGRCWFLRRKINRVTPSGGDAVEKGQGSRESGLAEVASMSPSVSSVGLVNFGRTPVQSVLGSSVGDVSMDSTAPSSRQQPVATAWAPGDNVGEDLHESRRQDVAIEMESLSQQANASTAAVYQYDAAKRSEEISKSAATGCQSLENGCNRDLESCGILAFMSSSNSIELSPKSREKEEREQEDLENCGTLVFMSLTNSIAGSAVPLGTQIAQGISHSTTTAVVCASAMVEKTSTYGVATTQGDASINLSTNTDKTVDTFRGGVTPSVSTESNQLREKKYERMIESGRTVGLGALRELASSSREVSSTGSQDSATAMSGFSNPLCGEGRYSRLERERMSGAQGQPLPLPDLVQNHFPPPIQVSLTGRPMPYDHILRSSTPTLL